MMLMFFHKTLGNLVFINCSLVVRADCVTDNSKGE